MEAVGTLMFCVSIMLPSVCTTIKVAFSVLRLSPICKEALSACKEYKKCEGGEALWHLRIHEKCLIRVYSPGHDQRGRLCWPRTWWKHSLRVLRHWTPWPLQEGKKPLHSITSKCKLQAASELKKKPTSNAQIVTEMFRFFLVSK